MIKAVVSVVGRDQKGVVAKFATRMAEHGVNIEDLQQQVVHGRFIMDMLVDLSDLSVSLDELITELIALGKTLDMEVRVTLQRRSRKRVALLVSKERHCLDQLIEDHRLGKLQGDLVAVLSNHPDLEPIAREAGLPYDWHPASASVSKNGQPGDKVAHFNWLQQKLAQLNVDLIVLARYMQVLPTSMVQSYRDRIINIHPSLLPYFPGANAYEQAWKSGVRVSGCTAHFVTENLDEGPVVLQDVFHIEVGKDTSNDVKKKGQALEATVLSQAVQMFLDEKLLVVDGKVVFRPGIQRFLENQ